MSLVGWLGGRADVLLGHALPAVGDIFGFAEVLSDLASRKARPSNVIALLDALGPALLGRKSCCRMEEMHESGSGTNVVACPCFTFVGSLEAMMCEAPAPPASR